MLPVKLCMKVELILSFISYKITGFPQRLENLENENGHGTYTNSKTFCQFFISHVILPILHLNCTNLNDFCHH